MMPRLPSSGVLLSDAIVFNNNLMYLFIDGRPPGPRSSELANAIAWHTHPHDFIALCNFDL